MPINYNDYTNGYAYDPYNNRYNPVNPHNPNQQYYRSQAMRQYTFVNGIEGAKSYPVQPNQSILLMDADYPICYKKESDQNGKCVLSYYELKEIDEATVRGMTQPVIVEEDKKYASKEDIDAINKRLDEIFKNLTRNNNKKEPKENVNG